MSARRVRVVGVTGGIGAGKSTLCRLLQERHQAQALDADALGHDALRAGTTVHEALVARFGEESLGPDRALSRPHLAKIVFADDEARRDLEKIVHPWILDRIAARVAALRASNYEGILLLEAALLLDWVERRSDSDSDTDLGSAGAIPGHSLRGASDEDMRVDGIVVVTAPLEQRLERLSRRGLTEADARARIRAQRSDPEWIAAGDWVVENSGSKQALTKAADRLWSEIGESWPEQGRRDDFRANEVRPDEGSG